MSMRLQARVGRWVGKLSLDDTKSWHVMQDLGDRREEKIRYLEKQGNLKYHCSLF
jgi:hypothetical protein